MMQIKWVLLPAVVMSLALAGCDFSAPPSAYVGVMIDNHEAARPYQRGLEEAVFVQEQLVEGFITRFEAVFDINNLPESVGPVRSVRPYFIDGTSSIVSAIMHVGGSPEALEKLNDSKTVTSFNALRGFNDSYSYDKRAPAPHHRFITGENIRSLFSQVTAPQQIASPIFPRGSFTSDAPAKDIAINYYSPLHNVEYDYDPEELQAYIKQSNFTVWGPSPKNLIMLETDVKVVGPLGRLGVRMVGSGAALLFRDGGMKHATWSKADDDHFFVFRDDAGKLLNFAKGQVWMIVLDSLDRVTWEK